MACHSIVKKEYAGYHYCCKIEVDDIRCLLSVSVDSAKGNVSAYTPHLLEFTSGVVEVVLCAAHCDTDGDAVAV